MEAISASQILPIISRDVSPLASPGQEASTGKVSVAFKDVLLEGLQQVNVVQADAEKAVEALFTGGDINTAEVLTAVKKADMSFRLMMQMRNKLVQAYQEIRDIRI